MRFSEIRTNAVLHLFKFYNYIEFYFYNLQVYLQNFLIPLNIHQKRENSQIIALIWKSHSGFLAGRRYLLLFLMENL